MIYIHIMQHAYQQKVKELGTKFSPSSLKEKQPSTGNHANTLLTPTTPNFNVVIGSAIIDRNSCFLKAAKHKIQKTTLNWGTGGHDVCGVVFHGMAVFFEDPGRVM